MVKYSEIFYFSVNAELIEIILFKTAYREHFFQTNYYITSRQTSHKTYKWSVFSYWIKKPKAQQKIKDPLPQTDLPDVPDMTFSFFPAHLF